MVYYSLRQISGAYLYIHSYLLYTYKQIIYTIFIIKNITLFQKHLFCAKKRCF